MNMEMEQESVGIQDELKKVKEQIAAEEVRSSKKGNDKFKKLFERARHAELRYRLEQWKNQIKSKSQTADKLEKTVLRKMNKRFLREAFDKYRKQCKRSIQHDRNEKGADHLVEKFTNKRLKTIWNTWLALKTTKQAANRKFKKILNNYNFVHQKHYFEKWNKQKAKGRVKKAKKKQMMMVEEV